MVVISIHAILFPMSTEVTATVRKYPKLKYDEIKNVVIGKKYNLSLVFIGAKRAKTLNETYRKKTYTPNILSFPLDDTNGEIFIAPSVAIKEARKANMSEKEYTTFLLIHGLLHLKGLGHGDTMDREEKKYMKKLSTK